MKNINYNKTQSIGILAHSYEGATLCFKTMCQEGEIFLGEHMHPNIVLSAIPMGLSMNAWQKDNYDEISIHLLNGIHQLNNAEANFFVCPDNTAHIVLEKIIKKSKIPGLHIADVACKEIEINGWNKIGLLGTKWTMNGLVYRKKIEEKGLKQFIPTQETQRKINDAIFNNLCHGDFSKKVISIFIKAIKELQEMGADCVILGCTEIPLIINNQNSSLPVLDSTRLLSKYAVEVAMNDKLPNSGWIKI